MFTIHKNQCATAMVQPFSLQKRSQVLIVRQDGHGFEKVVCMAAVRILRPRFLPLTRVPPSEARLPSHQTVFYVCINMEEWISTSISTGQPHPRCLPMLWFPQEQSYSMFQACSYPEYIQCATIHWWIHTLDVVSKAV